MGEAIKPTPAPAPVKVEAGPVTPPKVAETATTLAQGAQARGASKAEAVAAGIKLAVEATKTDAPAQTED